MEQHPVPQNVTQYQFRLVGDMTLKQFLELAAGLVLAYLFYASNLLLVFKWPLIMLSILFGLGLAFFPIEDRPLDVWIVNFLKSIYHPTRFIWKKSNKVPALFSFLPHLIEKVDVSTKTLKAPAPSNTPPPFSDDLSQEEHSRLQSLDSLFSRTASSSTPPPSPDPLYLAPKPKVVVRKLKPPSNVGSSPIFQSPSAMNIPANNPTNISTPSPATTLSEKPPSTTVFSAPSVKQTKIDSSFAAAPKISLPAPPTAPNLVVGMVVNREGRLVENAIVQIVNNESIPQRAIKTNSLGQFYTSTPLSSGTYLLEVEKEGLTFSPKKLVIENKVVSPLLLQATA